jgi:hypothetical protein
MSVPLVQDQLAELEAAAGFDPDAKMKAIRGAFETAIWTLPNPYRDAAREHFGFTDNSSGKPWRVGVRRERAADKLGMGDRLYREPHREYLGMKPGDYVIALVACALCGISDPIAYIARRESADAEASSDEPQAELGSASGGVDASDAVSTRLAIPSATMVSRDANHLEVFWVGPNNEVFYRWLEDGHDWSSDSWDEPAAISLAAVSRGPGDEVLFGLSPDGRVWYRVWELNSQGWYAAGDAQWLDDEIVRGPLASASRGQDMIELFAFDVDGQPWHRWTEGGMNWSPWTHWSIE